MTLQEALEIVSCVDNPHPDACEAEQVLRNLVTSVTQIEAWLVGADNYSIVLDGMGSGSFYAQSHALTGRSGAAASTLTEALHAWARTVQRSTTKETS